MPDFIVDRVVACIVGAFIGALVVAWLMGVNYDVGGIGMGEFVVWGATFFGLIGLVFGTQVGSVLGELSSSVSCRPQRPLENQPHVAFNPCEGPIDLVAMSEGLHRLPSRDKTTTEGR